MELSCSFDYLADAKVIKFSFLRSIKKLPAEKEGHKIAVEIKDFDAPSVISELEKQMQRR